MKELNLKKRALRIDFHVRWNTTFLMINRFLKYKIIIKEITTHPEVISGIEKSSIEKLKKLYLSNFDWEIAETLSNVLLPFYKASNVVSGRNYATLSSFTPEKYLLQIFLKTKDKSNIYEQQMKNVLLNSFEHHFDTKLSAEQKKASLVTDFFIEILLNLFFFIFINEKYFEHFSF